MLKIKTDTYPNKLLLHNPYPQQGKLGLFPLGLFFTMEGFVLLAGALLSSSSGNSWFLGTLLEHVFSTGASAAQALPALPASLSLITDSGGTLVFLSMFALVFVLYLLAVRYLPRNISHRFVLLTTLLLGGAYLFIPILTSQDMFSYIAYARMGVVYHLNPLTTLPTSIASDAVYPLLYWIKQPSAYGPTWTIITCALQWVALLFGFRHLLSIEMLLRVLGLSMHLGSIQLIWSISGHLPGAQPEGEGINGRTFFGQRQRLRAMLAFAWNPFLLLEACVNAHSDIMIVFFVLLALWLLLPQVESKGRGYVLAALVLALATCIKITLVLLLPGLLLFLWRRHMSDSRRESREREVMLATGVYIGVVVLLYAPFWQHGAVLQLLRVSPAMSHDVNSLYQFVFCLIACLKGIPIPAMLGPGSSLDDISHQVSMVLFATVYIALCLCSLATPRHVNTLPALIRWMAIAWLLYCVIGSPWFWPWYTITFFGLLALIEADGTVHRHVSFLSRPFPVGSFARLLTINMFSLYSFSQWQPARNALPYLHNSQWLYSNGYFPLLSHFRWEYFAGLWIWAMPFVAICIWFLLARRHQSAMSMQSATGGKCPPK
ncbi:MAG TPA: glycosyltransferase family 39 protein [Ktedonobacteraceae bacterium]